MLDLDYQMMVRAAWYYYLQNHTQQEIAHYLGVSRAKVIRLLDTARREDVIQFVFRPDDSTRMQQERAVIERFGLRDAYVVPAPMADETLNDSLARAASMYVGQHIEDGAFVNMGFGDTMGLVLGYLANSGKKNLSIICLTGGVSYYLPTVSSGVYNMKLYLVPSPLIVSRPEVRDALVHESQIKDVFKMSSHSSMSLVGIGSMSDDATIIRNEILSKSEFTMLGMQNAVGDILSHFIDKDGNPVATDVESRLISTDLDDLRAMENVIGVAGGPEKHDAIRAVLKSSCLDVLVTDELTAQALLDDK